MATYYDIFGQKVQYLSSDPANVTEGQVWYNSTSNTAKVQGFNPGSFASAPTLNTATRAMFGGGTQTAAIKINGANPGTNYSSNVEEYDGSSWSEVNNTPTATDQANRGEVGLQTATLMAGGVAPGGIQSATYEYDGTNWTSGGSISDSRGDGAMWGVLNSTILTGGYNEFSPPYWTNATEEYDGTSWTAGTATPLNTTGSFGVGASQTSGMLIGGQEDPGNSYPAKTPQSRTLTYDGTSWTTLNPQVNSGNVRLAFGDMTAAVVAGSSAPTAPTTASEVWDATSWTSGPSLTTGHANGSGAGTGSSSGLIVGGQLPPGNIAAVDEWNSGPVTQTITTS